jgi:hypothetical protein
MPTRPTPRQFVEANLMPRSALLGAVTAVGLWAVGCLEASVMVAMFMPGVYLGFAFVGGSWIELLEELTTTMGLVAVYVYCVRHVQESIYLAPASVAIHGLVDMLHHFQLYPSEKHVHACWPNYPLVCACFDLSCSLILAGCLYFFDDAGSPAGDQ